MLKVFLFLVVGIVIVTAAWFVAGIPGHVTASLGTYTLQTSTPLTILLLVVLWILLTIVIRILRAVFGIPAAGGRWRRQHRHASGERAVTRVLVALAAGEQATASKEARRARTLLGNSPQTLLLVAEASRLSGREDEAEEAFRALTQDKDAKFLGLRGLLRQAIDRRDWSEALVLANQAEAAHPGTVWLRQQRAELALQTDNWAEALDLTASDPRRTTYYVAAANSETDASRALRFAKQAWKLDPGFTPAALAYATRLQEAGKVKRAQSVITEAWKRAPHPDLGAFILANQSDKLARLQAVKNLIARNPSHVESQILMANAAYDAGMFDEARQQIEAAINEGVNQRRLYLLLAEIEEQERGDTEAGRLAQREALRHAAVAEPDPQWQCSSCHTNQAAWQPKCAACDNIGTINWVTPAPIRSNVPVLAG